MQIYVLASGSGGNCTLVKDGDTSILIDIGISVRRVNKSLAGLGMRIDDISGIFITHEHSDHVCGIKTLIKHCDIPIFAPRTVANRLCWSHAGVENFMKELKPLREHGIGRLGVMPFPTPHDTPESVGYRVSSGASVFGLCTDCGCVTDEMLAGLKGADLALIEANHDTDMLINGPYPPHLKRRILSDLGHLSNQSCAELSKKLVESGTRNLILGHLSLENNSPAKAFKTVSDLLCREGADLYKDINISVAPESGLFCPNVPARLGGTRVC